MSVVQPPMADQIVAHPQTMRQAAVVIRQAHVDEPEPVTREYTLFYSGVTYGVEVMQQQMIEVSRANMKALRSVLGAIDQTTPMIDDVATLERFTGLRTIVAELLNNRTKDVRDAYMSEMGQMFSIDEKWISETKPLSIIDDDELALVGHKAFRTNPAIFYGWHRAVVNDTLDGMKCKCPRCLVRLISEGPPIVEWQEVEAAVEHHGGFVKAFRAYAEHIIGDIRTNMERDMEEIQNVHIEEKGHAGLLQDILQRAKKGDAPEQE